MIAHYFPGSGITVHNVWATEFRWWQLFVSSVVAVQDAREKAREAQERRGRGN